LREHLTGLGCGLWHRSGRGDADARWACRIRQCGGQRRIAGCNGAGLTRREICACLSRKKRQKGTIGGGANTM
jgi:hypothetical protein